MKKNLLFLICLMVFVFACGKSAEDVINNEQIPSDKELGIQLQEEPKDAETLFKNGKAKLDKSDFEGAIVDFTKSLEIREKSYVRADLGRAKEANGDLAGALADYTKAIEAEKRGLYYQWRSNLYTKMGKEAEAKKDMAEFEKLPKE